MTGVLNAVSELAYRAWHSRTIRVAFVGALGVCIVLLALARGEEDTTVLPFDGSSSPVARLNRYVSVVGTLRPESAFQTQVEIGGLRLSGARYIPLVIPGASDPLFVLDKDVPRPDVDGKVHLVGKIQEGGAQMPYYLEIGQPPNIPLQNALARAGLLVATALLLAAVVAWWIGRSDYALAVAEPPVDSAPAGVGALWFGSLGPQFGHAVVRQAPVVVVEARAGIRLESSASGPPWTVHICDVVSARPTGIATAWGALPAARIEFHDERGLLRRGTLAVGGEARARDALSALLGGQVRGRD